MKTMKFCIIKDELKGKVIEIENTIDAVTSALKENFAAEALLGKLLISSLLHRAQRVAPGEWPATYKIEVAGKVMAHSSEQLVPEAVGMSYDGRTKALRMAFDTAYPLHKPRLNITEQMVRDADFDRFCQDYPVTARILNRPITVDRITNPITEILRTYFTSTSNGLSLSKDDVKVQFLPQGQAESRLFRSTSLKEAVHRSLGYDPAYIEEMLNNLTIAPSDARVASTDYVNTGIDDTSAYSARVGGGGGGGAISASGSIGNSLATAGSATGRLQLTAANPAIQGSIVLNTNGGEALRITPEGKFYVKGVLVEDSKRIADAFVDFTNYTRNFGMSNSFKDERDVTSQRSSGVTYTNTSLKPKQVSVTGANIRFCVNGQPLYQCESVGQMTCLVPPGMTYNVQPLPGAKPELHQWREELVNSK